MPRWANAGGNRWSQDRSMSDLAIVVNWVGQIDRFSARLPLPSLMLIEAEIV